MAFPSTEVFLGLLVGYMVYSVWARLDARYPIAAALVLLVATAVVDALGSTASANTLAEFVFFLLGAGVVLLLIDHVREGRGTSAPTEPPPSGPTPQTVPSDLSYPDQRNAEESLDSIEQEPVPLIHALRDEDQNKEQYRDPQPHAGQY